MMISQFIISKSVELFIGRLEATYGLRCVNKKGYDENIPCFFFGMYDKFDAAKINSHKGLAILVWCGSDVHRDLQIAKIKKGVRHVAISHWVRDKLWTHKIGSKFIPVCFTFLKYWAPEPLGNKIYCYAPNEYYGLALTEEIQKEIPFEMIITKNHYKYNLVELEEIYKQSFIGLRLRNWYDGNSATVQGMGLMGRRSVWNGENPAAVSWSDKASVIEIINKEAKKIGSVQRELAKEVFDFYSRKDWLEEKFWSI